MSGVDQIIDNAMDTVLNDIRNQEILLKMKSDLEEACRGYFYELKEDGMSLDKYKEWCDTIAEQIAGVDNTITKEINETDWPDRIVLNFLQNNGWGIDSIHELAKVRTEWKCNEEGNPRVTISATLKKVIKRVIIEIDIINKEEKQ